MLFLLFSTKDNDDSATLEKLELLIKTFDISSDEKSIVFPFSHTYVQSIITKTILKELPMNILGALVAVFLCTLLFLGNLPITLIICGTVSITLLDVAGTHIYFMIC